MSEQTPTLKERIVNALQGIFDPEIPVNIYDLGLIYSLAVDEEKQEVTIQMTLTTPMCPVAQTFPQTVQDQVLKVPGVTSVSVDLVWDPPWTKDNMSEAAKLQLNLL
jgi:FeS assembly SUF system protein